MIKYSVDLILYTHQPNAHKEHPIYLRIIIDRKPAYISTGKYILQKYWDDRQQQVKEGHTEAEKLNFDISTKKQQVVDKILERQYKKQRTTSKEIKQLIAYNLANLFDFVETYIKEVKNKREPATLENYRKHLRVLEIYHGSRNLHFEEITTDYLANFETDLSDRQKLSNNYIHAIWKTLKTFFNAAILKKITDHYPFDQYENPVYTAPGKEHLILSELKAWEKYVGDCKNEVLKQCALYFLLGAYSGLRISDWFQFQSSKHVEDNRIKLRAKKNGEWVTMPVSKPLKRIIGLCKEIPLTLQEPTINEKLKRIAGDLRIKKKISTHVARHTFAITICADRGISCETCAELMGITVKTCADSYYRVTNRKIDTETLKAWKEL